MYELNFKPEVYEDIKTAYDWYESQRIGLGEYFLLTLEESYVKITRTPKIYQDIYKNVRRKLVRRFPYGIFFCYKRRYYYYFSRVAYKKRATRVARKS